MSYNLVMNVVDQLDRSESSGKHIPVFTIKKKKKKTKKKNRKISAVTRRASRQW